MLAWYFAPKNGRLAYGDGRKIRKGVTHYVNSAPVVCQSGLHGNYRLIDALQYANSSIVYRIRLHGWKDSQNDKHCAQARTYLTDGVDIEDTLRAFARQCALDVIDRWDAPDVVRNYLETGDESIRQDAKSAARVAAWLAAWSAAEAEAEAEAWSLAREAAWSAAEAEAWSAAAAAARSAARVEALASGWVEAWSAQNACLERIVNDVIAAARDK